MGIERLEQKPIFYKGGFRSTDPISRPGSPALFRLWRMTADDLFWQKTWPEMSTYLFCCPRLNRLQTCLCAFLTRGFAHHMI
jgi:hypothetical protein